LTPKERVLLALEGREPDRVPSGEFATDYPVVEAALGRRTFWRAKIREIKARWQGKRDEIVESQKRDIVEFTRKMGLEMVPVILVPSVDASFEKPEFIGPNTWRDSNGNVLRLAEGSENLLTIKRGDEGREYTEDDFVYEKPEIDESQLELVRHVISELGDTHFIFARSGDGSISLPGGLLNGIKLCITKPDVVRKAVEVSLKRVMETDRIFAREGVDGLSPGADYGYNKGTFVHPKVVEDLFFPAMKAQCDHAHALGVKILKHSCGNNWPIMDLFVRAGYDAYQSIQPTAGMDIGRLKDLYGDRICLWGGVSCERLAGGSVEEARRLTRRALQMAAPGGGLICASSHSLLVGTKYDNYRAMLDEIQRFGSYPLS
jgi:uroporphyrinogen decarboxylase